LGGSIDSVATQYILTMDFPSLRKLQEKEYCEKLVEWMKKGNSFYTFGTQCDPPVCWDTVREWANTHPDFSVAKKIGRTYEMKWWDDCQRKLSATGEGNATAIIWAQKNKFPAHYKERAPKGQQQIQLNANMDVKQLIATMPPEQLAALVCAIEEKTKYLEGASSASDLSETK
ncbi:MAG: hypothetical protein WCK49_11255, partial [Myxococcaceae bacterium]